MQLASIVRQKQRRNNPDVKRMMRMGNYEWSSNARAMRALVRNHRIADIETKMAAQIAGG
jgi:hypothetical protein